MHYGKHGSIKEKIANVSGRTSGVIVTCGSARRDIVSDPGHSLASGCKCRFSTKKQYISGDWNETLMVEHNRDLMSTGR